MQATSGFVRGDRSGYFEKHVAGIESFIHLHDRNARFAVPSQDGGLHRRSSAMTRQQRSMNIDATERRQRKNGLRQDLPVGGDYDHVRSEGNQLGQSFGRTDLRGLKDGPTKFLRNVSDLKNLDFECAVIASPGNSVVSCSDSREISRCTIRS